MEHSIPTVTPDKGATLAVDDTGPDLTGTQAATPEPSAPGTTATHYEPNSQPEPVAAAQPRAGLKFTANSGDIMEIGTMLYQEAEAVLRSGQKKRLKVRIGRRTIAEMPLASGAVGVLLAAMAAVALSRLTVEVE